jgi:methylase of polypeptide subunit release factors
VPAVPGRAIHAYEISPASAHLASARAAKFGLAETYVVHNSCFWEGLKQTPCDCIISNPPYLPAPGEVLGCAVTCICASNALLALSATSTCVETTAACIDNSSCMQLQVSGCFQACSSG